MENVEGFLSFKFDKVKGISGKTYKDKFVYEIILQESAKMGYLVKYKILNAKKFGVPQNRPRVIFLGHQVKWKGKNKKEDLVVPPEFPTESERIVTIKEAISDLRFDEYRAKHDAGCDATSI